jgi:hypothetical protein
MKSMGKVVTEGNTEILTNGVVRLQLGSGMVNDFYFLLFAYLHHVHILRWSLQP